MRNTLIVNDMDILLAFWDMKSAGTKDTITKARKLHKRIFIYDTTNGTLKEENTN